MRELQKPYLTPISPQNIPQSIDNSEFVIYEEVEKNSVTRLLVNSCSTAASVAVGLLGTTAALSGVIVLKVLELSLRAVVFVVLVLIDRMSRVSNDYDSMPENPCRHKRGQVERQGGRQNMQFNNCHNITINNY